MKQKKIFVVGGATNYASWIDNYELVSRLEDANIVLFTGGEDVCPELYGEQPHYTTIYNIDRDLQEKEIFERMSSSQIAIGICRGLN